MMPLMPEQVKNISYLVIVTAAVITTTTTTGANRSDRPSVLLLCQGLCEAPPGVGFLIVASQPGE